MRVLPTMPAVAANSEDSALPTRDPCDDDDDDDDDEMTCDVTQKKTKYKRCMYVFLSTS